MSTNVLLNLLNASGKSDKTRGLPSILKLLETSLINSIIQEHSCKILYLAYDLNIFNRVLGWKTSKFCHKYAALLKA